MSASASLIPELEDVIQHGSQDKRAATVKRIANLFIDGAPHFNEDHIGLFDDVLCRLIIEIETKARAEMAQTLAPLANAPIELMRQLAQRRRYRGGRSGDHAVDSVAGNRAGRTGQDQGPGSSGRHRRPRRHRRGRHRRAGPPRRHRSDAQRRRQSDPPSCRRAASPRWSSARKATANWPRRSGSGRTFRRICSAICWCARRRWCSSACCRPPSRKRETKSSAFSKRCPRNSSNTAPARDYAAALARGRGAASGRQARRTRARRIRQGQKIRGDGRRACRCCAACRSRRRTG